MKKPILFVSIIFLLLSCQEIKAKITNNTKNIVIRVDIDSLRVPVLVINKNNYTSIKNLHFSHSVGGKPIEEETEVQMKYDTEYLYIRFECRNNPRLEQNYYTKDNSALFKQEVFEIYISNGEMASENYLEIQLNPNNALFLGKVMHRYKSDNKHKVKLVNTKKADVIHTVVKNSEKKLWSGYLQIPIKILQYPKAVSNTTFRMNLFRIISNEDRVGKKWKNSATSSTYGCWISTMAKKPQFHAPEYFGFLILD